MPARLNAEGVILGAAVVPFAAFPELVRRHLCRCPTTPDLEAEGYSLRQADFAERLLEPFVRRVCKWGGYPGVGGRILNQNSIVAIRDRFRSAMARLDTSMPDVGAALNEVNAIRGLGRPSFASKHLRFLRPDTCPVLDSIVSERLRYAFNTAGYTALAQDCIDIANALQRSHAENPRLRGGGGWYAADVEMAIFAYLNKLWI